MSESRIPVRLLTGAILALFIAVSLYLRVCLPYDQVFVGDWIKFTGNDAYYHMRLVDNLAHNFPHLTSFDPYMIYPVGDVVSKIHFFDYFLAAIIWVIGLGSPTQHTVDVVGAYFPAVLAALTVIPVYFLGKELLNRWAGIIAAGLIAVFSGEFLGRSIPGNTDHHVAEVLFTTAAMLFLLLAIKTARQRQLTFGHLKRRDWATIARPAIYSLLAALFLVFYLLTWLGALLFVFIIAAYFIIQFIIDHLRHRNTDYLCLVGIILFLPALIVSLVVLQQAFYVIPLIVALLIPPSLNGISRLMTTKMMKPAYYPLAVVGLGAGLGLAGFGVLHIANPSLLSSMSNTFLDFFGLRSGDPSQLATEMQPFLSPYGTFSLWLPWASFGTGFFLGLISLGILIYVVVKRGDAEIGLIVVWSLVILAATLAQRRYAYYLSVNLALLTGYLCWQMLRFAHLQMQRWQRNKIRVESEKSHNSSFGITTRPAASAIWIVVVFLLVFYPMVGPLPGGERLAIDTAKEAHFAPSDAWYSTLVWLRENTPDPFGNPDAYYALYDPPPPKEEFQYPDSAYGVLAWWDYGYLITRVAHRLPYVNPGIWGDRAVNTANFLLSSDEDSANKMLKELDSRYIVLDYVTAIYSFPAITTWSEREKSEFYEVYYLPRQGQLVPVTLFYPEYYTSLVIRLYEFDGQAVAAEDPMVISYEEKSDSEGKTYKEITSLKILPSYEEAVAYVSSQSTGSYRIVGLDPFISPVPLDATKHYRLIHSSEGKTTEPGGSAIPSVKVFEHLE